MSAIDLCFGLLLILGLVWLSVFDLRTHRLPDIGTLPLLTLGLIWSSFFGQNFLNALIGAASGYLAFALIQLAYQLIRGREGLGGGDAKLLAAGGAWCGLQGLAPIILIASLSGLVFALPIVLKKRNAKIEFAFGPFLALGILLIWWGQNAVQDGHLNRAGFAGGSNYSELQFRIEKKSVFKSLASRPGAPAFGFVQPKVRSWDAAPFVLMVESI